MALLTLVGSMLKSRNHATEINFAQIFSFIPILSLEYNLRKPRIEVGVHDQILPSEFRI
jgi:hypothetical protein